MSKPKKIQPLTGIKPTHTIYLGRFDVDPVPTQAGQWWFNTTGKTIKFFDGETVTSYGLGIMSVPTVGKKIINIYWDDIVEEVVILTE